MGRAIERATKAFHPDIDTSALDAADYIVDPDLSVVAGVPHCYWKLSGDNVVEMTAAEKAAQDVVTAQISKPVPVATLDERLRALEKKIGQG